MAATIPVVLCGDFAGCSRKYCNLLQGGLSACHRLRGKDNDENDETVGENPRR
jgi:hypothetical protein